jgi:hypothetical protein
MTQGFPPPGLKGATEADLENFLNEAPPDLPLRVSLDGDHWDSTAGHLLASRPELRFHTLFLRGMRLGDEGMKAMISSPAFASVTRLSVERCGITDRSVCALAQSPHAENLKELYLCNRQGIETGLLNEMGDTGAKALANSPRLAQLVEIDLWNTGVSDAGVKALVTSPYLTSLSTLTVWGTRLTREGAAEVKDLADKRWKQREAEGERFPPFCWLHTDYDERTLTEY